MVYSEWMFFLFFIFFMGVYKPITGGHHPEWGTCSVQAMFSAIISAVPWRSSFHKENLPGMNNEDLEFGLFGSTRWLDNCQDRSAFLFLQNLETPNSEELKIQPPRMESLDASIRWSDISVKNGQFSDIIYHLSHDRPIKWWVNLRNSQFFVHWIPWVSTIPFHHGFIWK